jgi:hypothetical protein
MKVQHRSGSFPRRRFLGTLGAGSLALSGSSFLGIGEAFGQRAGGARFFVREDRFGRMFPGLPAFAQPSQSLTEALLDIGRRDGVLDAKDPLALGADALLRLSDNNPNNSTHTAGTTFMGQFLDHDVTFDLGSRLGVAEDPEDAANTRTPSCDLDSVYGGGPRRSPELYGEGRDRVKFRVESGGQFEDLPRRSDGTAIIADPRNDENLMIAGLQAAFYLFHNHAVDDIRRRRPRVDNDGVFGEARRLTTWHYHWLILNEVLPLFIGQDVVEDVLFRGRKFYRPRVGFIPVEFQGAAYRFGHTMVRPSYRANLAGDDGFVGMIFDPQGQGQPDPVDLRGGARAPRRFIDWQSFFDFGSLKLPGSEEPLGDVVRRNKRIDTLISTPLFDLPLAAIATGDLPTSLPQRNLLRHVTWSLPSGQAIAREMEVPDPLGASDFPELADYRLGLENSTPLWYYILKEGHLRAGGEKLGPVGGRIVGEVFIGLLQFDNESYLTQNPLWEPTLPRIDGTLTGPFRMIDFLAYAGVDPLSRARGPAA